MKRIAIILLPILLSSPAVAGERVVGLTVPGMSCASCPFVVQAAIGAVDGVNSVTTDVEMRLAKVTFDDTIATVDAILAATANAGYPASITPGDS